MGLNADTAILEIEERLGGLLPSQKAFIYAPESLSAIAGGFGSGKTHAGCVKALLLSAIFPGNRGMIARYHSTDLEDTTKAVFTDVCPPSWIRSNKGRTNGNYIVLRNGSIIYFRHIHDAKGGGTSKTRRHGANLGWFFIDQQEELLIEHFNSMVGRLRYTGVPRHFGFGALNPVGHDWNWKLFFAGVSDDWERIIAEEGQYFQELRPKPGYLGIAVNSEENRRSNGGFVDDAYFDRQLSQYDDDWKQRYVYCSFKDFSGRIYKAYNSGIDDPSSMSVHNIVPFDIPKHWELVVGIDVGGDSPWAIVPEYIDDWGNKITVKGLVKAGMTTGEVASWIKSHLPWNENRTRYVIDWENKIVMLELAEYGIHCVPANKTWLPGVIRQQGYFKVTKGRPLPPWYFDTQPPDRIERFKINGSPRTFVFETFTEFRKDFDGAVWDAGKKNQMLKTDVKRFDCCDADRYVAMLRPEPSELVTPPDSKYAHLTADPLSQREAIAFDKRIAERQARHSGRGVKLHEMDMDEVPEIGPTFSRGLGEYDGGW